MSLYKGYGGGEAAGGGILSELKLTESRHQAWAPPSGSHSFTWKEMKWKDTWSRGPQAGQCFLFDLFIKMEETRTCLQAKGGILEVGFDERVGIGTDRQEGMGEWLAEAKWGTAGVGPAVGRWKVAGAHSWEMARPPVEKCRRWVVLGWKRAVAVRAVVMGLRRGWGQKGADQGPIKAIAVLRGLAETEPQGYGVTFLPHFIMTCYSRCMSRGGSPSGNGMLGGRHLSWFAQDWRVSWDRGLLVLKMESPGKPGRVGHQRCCRDGGQEAKRQENRGSCRREYTLSPVWEKRK